MENRPPNPSSDIFLGISLEVILPNRTNSVQKLILYQHFFIQQLMSESLVLYMQQKERLDRLVVCLMVSLGDGSSMLYKSKHPCPILLSKRGFHDCSLTFSMESGA